MNDSMHIIECKGRSYRGAVSGGGRVHVRHPLTNEWFPDTSGVDVRQFDDDGATIRVCAQNVILGHQWDLLTGLPRTVPVSTKSGDHYDIVLAVGQASVVKWPENQRVHAGAWHVDPGMSDNAFTNSAAKVFAEYVKTQAAGGLVAKPQ